MFASNQKFSTKDQDNDSYGATHCAERDHGAWWYGACQLSNLNGLYYPEGQHTPVGSNGITWFHFKGSSYSLKRTEMKVKPRY